MLQILINPEIEEGNANGNVVPCDSPPVLNAIYRWIIMQPSQRVDARHFFYTGFIYKVFGSFCWRVSAAKS